jgi:hypothetical protein
MFSSRSSGAPTPRAAPAPTSNNPMIHGVVSVCPTLLPRLVGASCPGLIPQWETPRPFTIAAYRDGDESRVAEQDEDRLIATAVLEFAWE